MPRHALLPIATMIALSTTSVPAAAQLALHARAHKSEGAAVTASLLGTVVPIAVGVATHEGILGMYGVYLGPSTGYFYTGNVGRGFASAGLRLGIVAAAYLGMAAACGNDWWGSCDAEGLATAIGVAGLGGLVASMIYDISNAGNAARHWNEQHVAPDVSIMPSVDVGRGTAGMRVRIAF